jgi:hypothetical protein
VQSGEGEDCRYEGHADGEGVDATPTASAKAMGLIMASSRGKNPAKTVNMIRAAAVTTRTLCRAPSITDRRALPVWTHSDQECCYDWLNPVSTRAGRSPTPAT